MAEVAYRRFDDDEISNYHSPIYYKYDKEIGDILDTQVVDFSKQLFRMFDAFKQISKLIIMPWSNTSARAYDIRNYDINSLAQDGNISITNALEILKSCSKPSVYPTTGIQYRLNYSSPTKTAYPTRSIINITWEDYMQDHVLHAST